MASRSNPKWPWIGCLVFLVALVFSVHRMGEIEKEFRPYWEEHMRRSSSGISASMERELTTGDFNQGMQVLARERDRNQAIYDQMAVLESKYVQAENWRNLSIGGLALFAILWLISGLVGRRAAPTKPHQTEAPVQNPNSL